jgi:molybdate transport system regulatory protein
MASNKKYTIEVRLWIEEIEGPFLGIEKIWLLEKPDRLPMLPKK